MLATSVEDSGMRGQRRTPILSDQRKRAAPQDRPVSPTNRIDQKFA